MLGEIYDLTKNELSPLFGTFTDLESGTGARVTSAKKGKLTIYHRNIAAGNQAEIAFDVPSLANRLGLSEPATHSFLAQLRMATGRPVELNARYQWPRVGLQNAKDVSVVMEMIRGRLAG